MVAKYNIGDRVTVTKTGAYQHIIGIIISSYSPDLVCPEWTYLVELSNPNSQSYATQPYIRCLFDEYELSFVNGGIAYIDPWGSWPVQSELPHSNSELPKSTQCFTHQWIDVVLFNTVSQRCANCDIKKS